jgi:hypothetical protein
VTFFSSGSTPAAAMKLVSSGAISFLAVATALFVAPVARANSEECDETLTVYDPYDLVADTDLAVDYDTLTDVEGLVDDYTAKIDETLDAEFEDMDLPEGISSDDLIDEGRSEIEDATDLGRSIAGCED